MLRFLTVTAVLALTCAISPAHTIWYVDASSPGGNGQSWATAFQDLQEALDAARNGGGAVTEIWVAGGIYRPDRATGERSDAFALVGGVTVYGGFPVGGGTFAQRDPTLHETILSGDLGVPSWPDDNSYHVVKATNVTEAAVLDGCTVAHGHTSWTQPREPDGAGVYIVSASPTFRNCTIRDNTCADADYTEWYPGGNGAGVYCSGGSPLFENCTITGNRTGNGSYVIPDPLSASPGGDGGGLFFENASPYLLDCTISSNRTARGATTCNGDACAYSSGGKGGGIYLINCQDAVVDNCRIAGNLTGTGGPGGHGGGIFVENSTVVLVHCDIDGNQTGNGLTGDCAWWGGYDGEPGGSGGGIRCDANAVVQLLNCAIVGNTTGTGGEAFSACGGKVQGRDGPGGDGGGIDCKLAAATIVSCTVAGNETGESFYGGFGEGYGAGMNAYLSIPTIHDTIFWGNIRPNHSGESSQIRTWPESFTITYSCVEGWTGRFRGVGNTGGDPLFVNPGTHNYRLAPNSACIDAADNTVVPPEIMLDLDGNPRFVNDPCRPDTGLTRSGVPEVLEMGAYEFQKNSCERGDLNCDGAFNGGDIDPFFLALGDPAAYAAQFPNCPILLGDMNCDGRLDGGDIDAFFAWLAGNIFPDCNANGIRDDCDGIGPLAIVTQPQSTLACVGDTIMLSVETSSPPLTFQWRKNGNPIAGATSTQLLFNSVQLSDAGDYDVIVGDACVSLTSDIATLTVHVPPSINMHPQSQIVCLGAALGLSVDASGPALTYQWRKNGTDIPGATDPTYTVPAVSESDRGVYDVAVANSCATVRSYPPALVTIQTTIITHPAGQTVCENDPVFFSVGAAGAALTYQWRKDAVNISGATLNFFIINAAAMSDSGIYDVVVTSATCTQTSDPAPLVVQQCP